MSKSNSGFSPTLHLINALSTTLQGSVPEIAKCSDMEDTCLCGKTRKNNIHLCVDVKGELITLAVCNSKEGHARGIIIHPYQERSAYSVSEKVLQVLKKSSLNAEIEVGVSGGCKKILQKARNTHPIQTPMPIDSKNVFPKRARRYKAMPTQQPVEVKYSTEEALPVARHLAMNMARVPGAKMIEILNQGPVCTRAAGQSQVCVYAQDDHVLVAICSAKKDLSQKIKIVLKDGIDVHKIANKVTKAFKGSLVESLDCLPSPQVDKNPVSNKADKEEKTMAKKVSREDLRGRELEVFDILVGIANGDEGTTWLIEDYNEKLLAALPEDFPKGVSSYITKLKRKEGLVTPAGRGNIKVRCLWPPEETPDEDPLIEDHVDAKATEDAPEMTAASEEPKSPPEKGELTREELIGSASLAPDPSTVNQLMDFLGRIEDPAKVAEDILSDLDMNQIKGIRTLCKLYIFLVRNKHCPQFTQTDEGTQLTMIID